MIIFKIILVRKRIYNFYKKQQMKIKINFTLLFIVTLLLSFNSCISQKESPKDKSNIGLKNNNKINVGVYNGSGASPICVIETMEALKIDNGISPVEISASDIMTGKLDELDVIVFPGGSGSKEYNSLGQLAAKKVKEFGQQKNKGIVGICAGGYLLSSTPTYVNLDVLGVKHTRKYYDRGRGLIGFKLNDSGKKIFHELSNSDSLFVQYYDGPIFENSNGLKVLGTINSDIATHKGYPHNFTQGKPAFFTKKYGAGKVFVSVGHPEATAGMRWMVPRMARWVSNKKLISYPTTVVRPEINKKEILFVKETKKIEKKLFWLLTNDDPQLISKAIDDLHALRSRPSIRWSIGLLRHENTAIRLKAAKYLIDTEYTAAIPDLEAAVLAEENIVNKKRIQSLLDQLKDIVK